jgi:hypothetical protein
MIRLLRKQRMLGFVPKFGEVKLDEDAEAAVIAVFTEAGITLRHGHSQNYPGRQARHDLWPGRPTTLWAEDDAIA